MRWLERPKHAGSIPQPEETAENAEIAEADLLCGLRELRGFFFVVGLALHLIDLPESPLEEAALRFLARQAEGALIRRARLLLPAQPPA